MNDTAKKPPLDEVMLAMDVVDTLRRRQQLVAQELDEEGRAGDLLERLRKIYAGQGIEVPDHVLAEGVAALKEDRFVYKPPAPSLASKLARLYVRRGRWGKGVAGAVVALLVAWGAYHFLVVAPQANFPGQLEAAHRSAVAAATTDAGRRLADEQLAAAKAALSGGDKKAAQAALDAMKQLQSTLDQAYTLQIVSRPGERSGVWRIPDANRSAKNYYIIVEPVGADGRILEVPVVNEETGKTERVSKWALRVEEKVFQRIAADKQDDGIIQDRVFGTKQRGQLKPDYRIQTTGAALTQW